MMELEFGFPDQVLITSCLSSSTRCHSSGDGDFLTRRKTKLSVTNSLKLHHLHSAIYKFICTQVVLSLFFLLGITGLRRFGQHSHQGILPQHRTRIWLGPWAQAKDEVSHSQHAEEKVHGFMEGAFSDDDEDDEPVPKESNKVGNKEGERDPCVLIF